MKTAVTFFVVTVFTTLFLESSTVSVGSTAVAKGSGILDGVLDIAEKPIAQTIANIIASKIAALADVIKAVDEALKKAKGAQKATLTEVKKWLSDLDAEFDVLLPDILAAVASGTKEDLGNVIPRLSETIKRRAPEIVKYIALLGATPGKQTSPVLVILTEKSTFAAAEAVLELQLLRTLYVTASL